jgi:hypothetical protein
MTQNLLEEYLENRRKLREVEEKKNKLLEIRSSMERDHPWLREIDGKIKANLPSKLQRPKIAAKPDEKMPAK